MLDCNRTLITPELSWHPYSNPNRSIIEFSSLQEQRAHIQILDTALSNAQATITRLEEENRLKEGYAERVKQMTKSLEQLQAGQF